MKRWLFVAVAALTSPALGAFPTVTGITTSSQTTNSNSPSATLPATIAAGDLIGLAATIDSNSVTVTCPAGFTEIYNNDVSGSHIVGVFCAKDAVGDEDGSSVTFNVTGTAQKGAFISFLIPVAEWAGNVATDIEGTISSQSGTGTDPNPPSHTASWGSADNLWIAICHSDAAVTYSVYSEIDNNISSVEGSSGGAGVAISTYDGAAATTRDPTVCTISSGEQRLGGTVPIEPATVAASTAVQRRRHMQ